MSQIAMVCRTVYTQSRANIPGWLEAFMKRLVLFAALLSQSSLIFCQSTSAPQGVPQVPGNVSMGPWPFSFNVGRPGQTAIDRPAFKSFHCASQNTIQNQASAPIDLDHLFIAPCADVKSHVELFAFNTNSFSSTPLVVGPHAKGEPIPTQWPKAKIERIPTQWPNLKLQPIDKGAAGLVPASGRTK